MLAEVETKVLTLLDSAYCENKLSFFPLKWNQGRISVNFNCRRIYGLLVCSVLLLEDIFSLKQLTELIGRKKMNLAILQMIWTIRFLAHTGVRMNNEFFKIELARLINQSLRVDSTLGNHF